MKRLFSILLIITILIPLITTNVFAKNYKWTFVVTAYYSPLADQEYYLTGDYESEKRLNWQGIMWASGKGVFSWMLAAPKNYYFWTKIDLEWLWVWVVEDRWWAIVNAGNRWYSNDRIDVWVWYGDEWLRRALYWGKRTISGDIISDNTKVTLDYTKIPSPYWATNWLKKIPNIFNTGIWIKSEKSLIISLQKFLTEINVYSWEISGKYNNSLINLIYEFQIENALIRDWELYWAGYWGKATRALYLKKYLNWDFDKKETLVVDSIEKDKTESIDEYLQVFESSANSAEKIKLLQNLFIDLWFYSWELTWLYDDLIDPVYDYQLSEWIVSSIYSPWAGSYWPKTRAALKTTYDKYTENKDNLEEERLRVEKEKQQEELRKKELEEKYKQLEELSLKKAEEKISFIWTPKFWEISHSVRELQVTLNKLWYFNNKDTAIYWNITKQSIIAYQIDKNIIWSNQEFWAWIIWPMTKSALKNDLKDYFMNEIVNKELANLDLNII